MEWEQKIRQGLNKAFEYRRGRQKRIPPEEVETPEEGAERLFIEVTKLVLPKDDARKEGILRMQHIIYQMRGRRMGIVMEKGLCFVDELMPETRMRIGVMSNGVHIQKYSMSEYSIEPPGFSQEVTAVPETTLNMGLAVARWLKKPYIELGKHDET